MTIIIKKSDQKKSYKKKLARIKTKGFDAGKYLGRLDITANPSEIQKRLRDEYL